MITVMVMAHTQWLMQRHHGKFEGEYDRNATKKHWRIASTIPPC